MSLVAYGSSDESESEDEEDIDKPPTNTDKPPTNTDKPPTNTDKPSINSGEPAINTLQLETEKTVDKPRINNAADSETSIVTASATVNGGSFDIEDDCYDDYTGTGNTGMFSSLPTTQELSGPITAQLSDDVIEDPEELKRRFAPKDEKDTGKVGKSKKSKVKITVPSLNDFKDDEEEEEKEKKKVKPSTTGSGLFSLLPPPVHGVVKESHRLLIPYNLTKKKPQPAPTKINSAPKTAQPVQPKPQEEEEDMDTGVQSFFTFTKDDHIVPKETKTENAPLDFASGSVKQTSVEPVSTKIWKDKPADPVENEAAPVQSYTEQSYAEPSSAYSGQSSNSEALGLTNEALRELGGGRRACMDNISIIDVSADSNREQVEAWHIKQLSEEKDHRARNKRRGEVEPSGQQKRKHQITYLAHQAKEMELELKNSWASSRANRMQSQSKYGF